MRHTLVEMFKSWEWELSNQMYNRIPDPIDYIETRIKTGGFELLELLNQSDKTPPELYQDLRNWHI